MAERSRIVRPFAGHQGAADSSGNRRHPCFGRGCAGVCGVFMPRDAGVSGPVVPRGRRGAELIPRRDRCWNYPQERRILTAARGWRRGLVYDLNSTSSLAECVSAVHATPGGAFPSRGHTSAARGPPLGQKLGVWPAVWLNPAVLPAAVFPSAPETSPSGGTLPAPHVSHVSHERRRSRRGSRPVCVRSLPRPPGADRGSPATSLRHRAIHAGRVRRASISPHAVSFHAA